MRFWILYGSTQVSNLIKAIDELPMDGSKRVTITENKVKRSDSQNGLYWMWVTLLGDNIGYTKSEMHDALRDELLVKETYKNIRGEIRECLPSTSKMGVKEFAQYLSAIERWASAEGFNLPRPEDLYHEAMGR